MNFKPLEGLTIVKVREDYVDSVVLTMSDGKSYRIDAFVDYATSVPVSVEDEQGIYSYSVLGFKEEV